MSIFHILRVFSMGHDFFSKTGFYTPVFHEQNLRCLSLVFAELRICCSWDNNLSHVCLSFFDQMPGLCSYFTCKVGFENSISRLRVIAMGNVLVYRLSTWLPFSRSMVRVRVSPTIFVFTLFFDLSLYHLLWVLKHVESQIM